MQVRVDEPGTEYVIRKTVINSVRFGVQPWLHVLYCSDLNDSLIFDKDGLSLGHRRVHGDVFFGWVECEHLILSGLVCRSDSAEVTLIVVG